MLIFAIKGNINWVEAILSAAFPPFFPLIWVHRTARYQQVRTLSSGPPESHRKVEQMIHIVRRFFPSYVDLRCRDLLPKQ